MVRTCPHADIARIVEQDGEAYCRKCNAIIGPDLQAVESYADTAPAKRDPVRRWTTIAMVIATLAIISVVVTLIATAQHNDNVASANRISLVNALQTSIKSDATKNAAVPGPVLKVVCTPATSADATATPVATYDCLAVTTIASDGTMSGYQFTGTIHTDLMTLEQTITTSAQTTTNAVKNASVTASSDATALWAIASDTCRGVWQSGGNCIELPPPIATP